MFILLVQVQVNASMIDEFKAAILENAARSVERDPGCVRFDVLQRQDDPTQWMFYEVYDQEEAWVEHRNSPHFLKFKEVGDRTIVSRDITKLTGVNIRD